MTNNTIIEREVALPLALPDLLAVGPFLKNTICVIRGNRAFLSGVHGDLGTPEAVRAFEAAIPALLAATSAKPVAIAHDLHPDFASTRHALALAQSWGVPAIGVQHHHAHIAALAAEHGLSGPLVGLALDGFGLGPHNQSWGGELIGLEGADWQRLGHLSPLLQPGGDVAAREPWRMAAAALHALGRGEEIADRWPAFAASRLLAKMLTKDLNSPPTTSAGRLFDAACGLLDLHPIAEFEGQAPMALEALATNLPPAAPLVEGWSLSKDLVLDFRPLLAVLAEARDQSAGAALFQATLAAGLADWAEAGARQMGSQRILLGGGCFFNRLLCRDLHKHLEARGLTVYQAQAVSPGDPGLSLGQAWAAGLEVTKN